MSNKNQQIFMAVFIAVVMVGSMFGFAMMQNRSGEEQQGFDFSSVIERALAPEERIYILRNGYTLIEYLYYSNCTGCPEKRAMYENFVNSEEFKGYVIMSTSVTENETADWILNLDGTRTELVNITMQRDMEDLFCEITIFRKPDICILREV
jgi:hypothetical protein